ncbi:hypothetical protein EV385_3078 [Krasilnikovia cinnamomea]|uniref:Uncharacterized protein n=1 Tax=Krasilnikovia cinnamomea TaxID=349313 RepID=A0A4Q7ZK26_9ACTN|nr:hypothetical protein [Krasilnikovia cinnamomea]RZU51268.1 hypothetical protein EV385_3078 [Krasilnikovia cinnamomea]
MLPVDAVMQQIAVEIDGLKQVAASLRGELEGSFRVQVPKVYDAVQPGATLGASIAGGSWINLQDSLHASLQGTTDALFNLDQGTQAVTTAAEQIARDYGDADAFSKAKVEDVHEIMVAPPQALGPLSSTIPAGDL